MTRSAIFQQPTLSTGEVSPSLYGRVDLQRYGSALQLCENFFVKAEGGVTKRPGTKFICPVKDKDNPPRLIEFQFSTEDTYVLEFGDQYMRVIRNGALVRENVVFQAQATDSSGDARFSVTTGSLPANGTQVFVTGAGTALSVRGRFLEVSNQSGSDFDLVDWQTGEIVPYDSDMSGVTITLSEPLEYATPYSAAEVRDLRFAQSADVLYLAHPSHAPRKLSRTLGGNFPTFSLDVIVFNERLSAPSIFYTESGWRYQSSGGAADYPNNYGSEAYVITAFDSTGVKAESLPTEPFTVNRDANWAATSGEAAIVIGDPAIATPPANRGWINDTGTLSSSDVQFPDGADTYRIYKQVGGAFLFIGEVKDRLGSFEDTNLTPSPGAASPPENCLPLGVTLAYSGGGAAGDAPAIGEVVTGSLSGAAGTVTLIGRGSDGLSGTVVLSGVTGTFTTSDTLTGDGVFGDTTAPDADSVANEYPSTVTFYEDRLIWAGSTLNPQTVWTSQSGDYENFSRSQAILASDSIEFTINARQVNKIESLVPLNDLLLLTSGAVWAASGAGENEPLASNSIRVRVQSYNGSSSVQPLFIDDSILYVQDKSRTIRDLGYEFATNSYRGNDLSVMSRHLFEDRTLVDWTLAKSPFELIWAVMSDGDLTCLTYLREHDIRGWSRHSLGGSGSVDNITSIPDTVSDTGRSIELDCPYMVVTHGSRVHIERLQPREHSGVKECWMLDDAVKVSAGEGASSKEVYGLWHLEGETVWALNAGNVEEGLTVTNGRVTLSNASASDPVLVGYPYTGKITTLDYNVDADGGALHAQRRRTSKIFIRTRDTRGLEVAQDGSSDPNPVKERLYVPDSPIALTSDVIEAVPTSEWARQGRVHIQSRYPLPAEILSIMPLITKGG